MVCSVPAKENDKILKLNNCWLPSHFRFAHSHTHTHSFGHKTAEHNCKLSSAKVISEFSGKALYTTFTKTYHNSYLCRIKISGPVKLPSETPIKYKFKN